MTTYNIDEVNVITKEAIKLERQSLHTSLVAAVKEKAYKPWDHYHDIPGEVEMIKLEDLLTIINSIFKE